MGLYSCKPCPCGSGHIRFPLIDARGIFCCFVCPDCESAKRAKYRPEIFEDSRYHADEDISEGESGWNDPS